jgi:SOS response regulatory protein OraA/RecX
MSHQGDDDLFSGRRGPRGDQRNDRRSVNVKGSSQGSSDQGSEAKCFAAAVRLLAGREYSVKELSAKLLRRFSADAVANVVAEMQAEGYVCNTRYGEAFCRSRVARGYGPVFIARELEQNGLDSDLIDALLQPHEDRWLEYAIAQVEKKASRGRSRGALFDHASAADSESGDAENREFDETGSADQRREAWQRDQKERGRLARFLARRGFSGAIASRAIKIGLSGQQQNDDEC